ncbi:MAG TPA: hypothetical protein VHL08_00400 [Dongiaceae bacterium]|nr:hypothetical protein [Dongiaceae bacterium]
MTILENRRLLYSLLAVIGAKLVVLWLLYIAFFSRPVAVGPQRMMEHLFGGLLG